MNTTIAARYPQRHRRHVDPDPGMRVGDSQRERTATRLGLPLSLGYLTLDDYDTRVQQAMQADTAARSPICSSICRSSVSPGKTHDGARDVSARRGEAW